MPTDHKLSTPSEKNQCQVDLTSEKVVQSSHTTSQEHFPTEKAFPQDMNQFKEKVKLSSGSLIRKKLRDSVLEEQRDHPLGEAKSEILKQECKVDTLNTCIREFQRQAHFNRLDGKRKLCA